MMFPFEIIESTTPLGGVYLMKPNGLSANRINNTRQNTPCRFLRKDLRHSWIGAIIALE